MVGLEHSLMMLLLLVSLLNAQARLPVWARWTILVGLALAFIVPASQIALPWGWLAALIIPLYLWQTARRLVSARWPQTHGDWLIWITLALGIGSLLLGMERITPPGTYLYGLLVASMVFRATEEENKPSHLGSLGPLALAFLLAEIEPAAEAPNRYFSALAGGAGSGALVGYLAVHAAKGMPAGTRRDVIGLGQVYLAYGIARAFGLSGIAAAVLSVAVFTVYGIRQGLWPDGKVGPMPLDSRPIFLLAVGSLAFFGWQAHIPLTPVLLLETGIGLLITAAAVGIGQLINSPTFSFEGSYLKILGRTALLLVPALLLWPRQILLTSEPLIFALVAAGLVTVGTHYILTPVIDLYSRLAVVVTDLYHSDQVTNTLLVQDVMMREVVAVSPQTPVPELALRFVEDSPGCILVIDADGRLAGIVTEADLFIKEKRLPRVSQTHPTLFEIPVLPEQLPEVYARFGSSRIAADVMTHEITWVKDIHSLGRAVRLMVESSYTCLPVLNADPDDGGKPVGIITRSNIIRILIQQNQVSQSS